MVTSRQAEQTCYVRKSVSGAPETEPAIRKQEPNACRHTSADAVGWMWMSLRKLMVWVPSSLPVKSAFEGCGALGRWDATGGSESQGAGPWRFLPSSLLSAHHDGLKSLGNRAPRFTYPPLSWFCQIFWSQRLEVNNSPNIQGTAQLRKEAESSGEKCWNSVEPLVQSLAAT